MDTENTNSVVVTVSVLGEACFAYDVVEVGDRYGVVFHAEVADHGVTREETSPVTAKTFEEVDDAVDFGRRVVESWGCRIEDHDDPDYFDPEQMDGDAESALASCGWGTDEDYGGECYDYEGGYED